MIYSSNLKTPSKLCSGSKSHDVQEVLKKKQVTILILLLFKKKGSIEFLSDCINKLEQSNVGLELLHYNVYLTAT